MRRLLIGLLLALAAGNALANACNTGQVEVVGTKTEVNTFGERCLGFELPGDATEASYNVTALSVPYAAGRTLTPLMDGTPVNTLNLPVRLKSGDVENVEVNYRNQEVAYLRVNFEVSVRDGTLTRTQGESSRDIATINPGVNITLPWGIAWVFTFGLIGIFAWPNATATATYDEVVPLSASPITYSVGGGGGCADLDRGASDSITVYPNRLRPGRLYELKMRLYCGRLHEGNMASVGQVAHDRIGLRWERDGVWQNSPFQPGGGNYPYAFRRLYPYNTPLYWEVPAPGYFAHAVAIDTGVFHTRLVPVEPNAWAHYQLVQMIYDTIYREDGDSEIRLTGYWLYSLPNHPTLGPVAVQETFNDSDPNHPQVTLLRLLPGSDLAEGAKRLTLSDLSLAVNSVTYQTQTLNQNDGSTITRSVPVYSLGPPVTHDIVIRTQTVGSCSKITWQTYDCGSHGRIWHNVWQ